jgi:hypothetical protein
MLYYVLPFVLSSYIYTFNFVFKVNITFTAAVLV